MPTTALPEWALRPAAPADVPALATLYADTARTMGGACYSAEQVAAWAAFGADTPTFRDYVLGASTWVAQRVAGGHDLLGFCGIDDHGEVRSFYVAARHTRRGLGSALLRHALAVARQRGIVRFGAWVTPFSRPVFERAGFDLQAVVRQQWHGVGFDRDRMARDDALARRTIAG